MRKPSFRSTHSFSFRECIGSLFQKFTPQRDDVCLSAAIFFTFLPASILLTSIAAGLSYGTICDTEFYNVTDPNSVLCGGFPHNKTQDLHPLRELDHETFGRILGWGIGSALLIIPLFACIACIGSIGWKRYQEKKINTQKESLLRNFRPVL